jgi:hypothetical protein
VSMAIRAEKVRGADPQPTCAPFCDRHHSQCGRVS